MKSFESFLAPKLQEYIDYRISLGYTDKSLKYPLRYLDRYVKEKVEKEEALTPLFFLGFRKTIQKEPRTVNEIISVTRGFFQFLVRQGHYAQNPLQDIPSCQEWAYIPFIFSPKKTEQLLSSVCKCIRKDKRSFLKDYSVYMAIVLMAGCGLRISEPLNLLRSNYRTNEKTIYIEKTKFKKDRLIPVPRPVAQQIENYLAVRDTQLVEEQNPYLLTGIKHGKVHANRLYRVFHHAVKDIGSDQPRRLIGDTTFGSPTPHCLRHSFAVNTLKHIKERGASPQKALPILASYMGHRKYRYTAVYLKVLDAEQRQELVDFNIRAQKDI